MGNLWWWLGFLAVTCFVCGAVPGMARVIHVGIGYLFTLAGLVFCVIAICTMIFLWSGALWG